MTWATLSSTAAAEAPGYVVLTVTCGGTMSGNCATGSAPSAITPAITMTIAMTIASRGRWMKTEEIIVVPPRSTSRRRCELRRDCDARSDALLSLDDDALTRLYPVVDDGEPVADGADTDAALLHLVVLADDKHV